MYRKRIDTILFLWYCLGDGGVLMAKVYVTQELAETIKSIRLQNKILSKDLAASIDKSPAYITKLERGDIQTIDVDELNKIFNYIVGKDSSFDETVQKIYSVLKYNYTDEEIEKQIWFSNYDTTKRKIPIPTALIDEINARLEIAEISRVYLRKRINANESLSQTEIENVDIPFNQWYSPENKPKGAQSIKINITEDILNGILDKTIDVTKYIFLLAISYYLIKIEKFKDVVDIDDDENSIMADAIELLSKHKFYSLTAKSNALDAAASHEEQLELLNSFDKKNYELVNSILRKIQLISDDDIKTTNKYLECFYKNLDWDLGFTFKIISLEFYRLENKGYSVKKELVDKIEKLVNEYIEISNNKTLIEKY